MSANKIAVFLPSLSGGGAERVMLSLASEFCARGIACDLIIAIPEGELLNSVPSGVRLVSLNKKKTISATWALARYLRQNRPDALLSTVFNANVTALLSRLVSLRKIRLVTCEASPTDWDVLSPSRAKTFVNKLAARILYRHADAIIAVSRGVRQVLIQQRLAREDRIFVIPNPAPSYAVKPFTKPHQAAIPIIVACGRLEPQKDYATLLRAFALLRNRIDARLVIMGEGALRHPLLQLATELGISADVRFMGFVSDPFPLLIEADVFVHTARYEGFGVVLLEALACHCPVVATDCPGGVRDVLADGKYGELVAVGDAIGIAAAMESVLTGRLSFPDPSEHLRTFELDRVAEAYISLLLPSRTSARHDEH